MPFLGVVISQAECKNCPASLWRRADHPHINLHLCCVLRSVLQSSLIIFQSSQWPSGHLSAYSCSLYIYIHVGGIRWRGFWMPGGPKHIVNIIAYFVNACSEFLVSIIILALEWFLYCSDARDWRKCNALFYFSLSLFGWYLHQMIWLLHLCMCHYEFCGHSVVFVSTLLCLASLRLNIFSQFWFCFFGTAASLTL